MEGPDESHREAPGAELWPIRPKNRPKTRISLPAYLPYLPAQRVAHPPTPGALLRRRRQETRKAEEVEVVFTARRRIELHLGTVFF